MEVVYSLKRIEIWKWYWNSWWRGGLKWIHLYLFLMVSAVFIYIDYSNDIISVHTFTKAALTFIAIFIFMVLFPQLMYKPQSRVLSINENGIHTKIAKYDKVIAWKEVSLIENNNDYINIIGRNKNAMLVPKRAFPSLEGMQEFYRLANTFLDGSKNA